MLKSVSNDTDVKVPNTVPYDTLAFTDSFISLTLIDAVVEVTLVDTLELFGEFGFVPSDTFKMKIRPTALLAESVTLNVIL